MENEFVLIPTRTTCVLLFLTGLNTIDGTSVVNSTTRIILPENINLVYFGIKYTELYLQPNGILAFDPRAKYDPHRNYSDPLKYWQASDDHPFIAPLLFEKKPSISSWMTFDIYLRSNQSNEAFLDHLGVVIDKSFVGVHSTSLTFAVSVEWHTEESLCNNMETCQNANTSLVLATDGHLTFAMLEVPNTNLSVQYQSGFNFGYGRGWFDLGLSLDRLSGRHLYLINKEAPLTGGCEARREQVTGTAFVSPTVIDMFGGNILEVSGPCFLENEVIALLFGDPSKPIAIGECFRFSEIKAKCEVPPLTARGRVQVWVSLDGGVSISFKTSVTVVHPTLTSRFVKLEGSGWGGTTARELTVRWNAALISTHPDAHIDILLVGYSEKTFWGFHLPLVKNVPVSQKFASFDSDDIPCDATCAEFEAGFVAVRVRNITHANQYRTMPSGAMPFGWLMRKYEESKHGSQWLHEKCTSWYRAEIEDMQWISRLDHCPCSLEQALLDFGRWQTDLSCNMYSKTPTCGFHKGAVHCVRSVGTIQKSGNQCCYGADGLLRYSEDTFQGSTPDRFHDWGADPYGSPGSVPSLSHGLADVMTFFYCCMWVDYKDCDFYMDVRPTTDCKYYKPPKQAMVFGQSHILTFDRRSATMCAEGDYVLYQDSNLIVHGRFQMNLRSLKSSFILTAIGIRAKDETAIIQLKYGAYQQNSKNRNESDPVLDVIVNDQYQFYEREDNKWQDFNHLTVVNNDDLTLRKQSNFTVLSKHGVGILVFEFKGSLQVTLSSLPIQMEMSGGLLSQVPFNDSETQIFSKWYVNNTLRQILPYRVDREMSEKHCPSIPQNFTSAICSGNKMCLYDYFTTGDTFIANHTRESSQQYSTNTDVLSKANSCGLLSVPRSTKSSFNYSLGNTVRVTGCRVGTLQGQTEYTCTDSGNSREWSPGVSASCSQDSTTKVNNQTSLAAGIVASVLIILIIMIAIIIWQRKKRNDKYALNRNDDPSFYM